MSTLTVRFAGICCFMNPRPGKNDKFAKRVLLPVDKHARDLNRNNDGQHIPYIEFDILDRPAVTGRFTDQFTYARDLVSYRRYHLSGDRISIANAVQRNGGHLNVLSTYDERVPSISKVTQGKVTYPDDKFYDRLSSADVGAIFDMQFGDLHAGPASLLPTRFSDPTDFGPARRLAQWVELQVPIKDGEKPMLVIESFNGNGFGKRTIELAETTDHITIGNQLKQDIEMGPAAFNPNLPPPVENFAAHFSMVYDLFNNVPANASRPQNGMTIRNGCVGSQIP